MWDDGLFLELEQHADSAEAARMAAYMKNIFRFLGIPKPELIKIIKPYLKQSKAFDVNWSFVKQCWNKDYREAQYVGIEYLKLHEKKLTVDDLPKLKELIITKSWWETTDAINHQQTFKERTNTSLLERVIINNLDQNEFFIQKAIGWSLRDYSKTNPEWVKAFLDQHQTQMSALSIKEAKKYL